MDWVLSGGAMNRLNVALLQSQRMNQWSEESAMNGLKTTFCHSPRGKCTLVCFKLLQLMN